MLILSEKYAIKSDGEQFMLCVSRKRGKVSCWEARSYFSDFENLCDYILNLELKGTIKSDSLNEIRELRGCVADVERIFRQFVRRLGRDNLLAMVATGGEDNGAS